jgi:hypothetical protein
MNGLGQTEGLLFHVRRVICLTLTAGLVVLVGLPITQATAQTPQLLGTVSQSCPYVNRDTAPARIEELKGRLAERSKAIEKTKSMLPGLQDGSRNAWTKADRIMSEAPASLMTSFASDYMTTTSSIKNRIKALRNSGASKQKIELWLKSMKGLEDAGSFLKKAPASFDAGTKFALEHQTELTNLRNEFTRTHKLLVDSGLQEQIYGEFAKDIGGPLGKLAFDAGVISIDLIVTTEEAFIDADAARRVQSAIAAMEWGYERDRDAMLRLEYLLADNCGKQPKEQMAKNDTLPESTPTVAEEAPAPAAPASAAAGVDMGPMILVGGAAVAGAAALAGGLSTATGTGADCGSAPTGFGSAWWSDYSSWCVCMGGTPVVSTTQCVQ